MNAALTSFLGDIQKQTAIIFGTKYGSTHDTALWIRNGMGKKTDILTERTFLLPRLPRHMTILFSVPVYGLIVFMSGCTSFLQPRRHS
jgi:hypothetical protein